MRDFAAIDFETANYERSSVCSVGVVIVRDGEIVDTFYSLIQPEPNYYNYWCTQVHGLCRTDTDGAPVFPNVWAQIEPRIEGLPLVAHNRPFDEGCLRAVFRAPLTKAAFAPSSAPIRWIIPSTSSSTRLPHPAACNPTWKTINSRPWPPPAASAWRITTMPSPMQRPAPG